METTHSNGKINSPKDLARTIKNYKCVVLKFSAGWCGPCQNKAFKNSYENLKLKYKSNSEIKFIEFDVDDDDEIINDKKYYNLEVNSIPYFLISTNGNFTSSFEGSGYLDQIDQILSKL